MSNPIRTAIYARVSTKPQAREDKISIPDQLRECKKLIEREGWLSVGEYVDPGVTANTLERPGLMKLLAAMDTWDVVIAWDFDRFYREKRSVAGYIQDTLDENKKQITSVKQPIPINDPKTYEPRENDSPFMLRELAGFTSGMDNRRRFRTLRKGRMDRRAQGYMMSVSPYGYRMNTRVEGSKVIKLPREIVPEKAAIIRRIFREYRDGNSYCGLARQFNRECIVSPYGKSWAASTISEILRNPVYCGKLRTNYHLYDRKTGQCRRNTRFEEWGIIQGKHKPIISEDLWNEVQEIRNRRYKHCRALGSPSLLSGLLRCGYCGWSMSRDGGWKGGGFICENFRSTGNCQRNYYPIRLLEPDVLAYVFRVVQDTCTYEGVQKSAKRNRGKEIEREVAQHEKDLADIPKRKNKIFTLYETGYITREELSERREVLGELEMGIKDTLDQKKKALQKLQEGHISREAFQTAVRILKDHFDKRELRERKAALASIIERITIRSRRFKVYFRYSPPSTE